MGIGIVVSDPGDWTALSIRSALVKEGADAFFLSFSDLAASLDGALRLSCQGVELGELEGLLIRDLGRGPPQDVAFRFEALRALEELGINVVNPSDAIARAANKLATSAALNRAGIPTPRTVVTNSLAEALSALREYGRAVSKPLFGYKGRGIALLKGDDGALLEDILASQGMVYLQEFVELDRPRDIRAFVVGERVEGAIYRAAPPGGWISNLAKGGRAEPCRATDELEDLAVRANGAVGAVYSGVDLLEAPEGLKVIEVNGTPSGRGIFQALGVDVGESIARSVLR